METVFPPADSRSEAYRIETRLELFLNWRRNFFFGNNKKAAQVCPSKRSGHRHIGGIPPRRHEYAANPGLVVAGIECPPAAFEIDLEPRTEVHGKNDGDADIAQITRGVACRNVERAAKGNGKMLKVATYADAFSKDIQGSLCRPGMLIVKGHFVVDPVANGLHAAPAGFDLSEQFKGNAGETIHFAVPAIKQEREHFMRQIADGLLPGRPIDLIRNSGVLN